MEKMEYSSPKEFPARRERKFADLWKLPPHHHYYTSSIKGQKWANGLAQSKSKPAIKAHYTVSNIKVPIGP